MRGQARESEEEGQRDAKGTNERPGSILEPEGGGRTSVSEAFNRWRYRKRPYPTRYSCSGKKKKKKGTESDQTS